MVRGGQDVIAKPKGNKREFNKTAIKTTDTYKTVVELTPTEDKTFDLTHFAAGCDEDIWIRLKWDGDVITPEIPVMAKTFPQYWVAPEYQRVLGDGKKKFVLEVKYVDTPGSCFGEIVGEEV